METHKIVLTRAYGSVNQRDMTPSAPSLGWMLKIWLYLSEPVPISRAKEGSFGIDGGWVYQDHSTRGITTITEELYCCSGGPAQR